jgi:predicted DsbA family dithiol-disulfide isomerase
MRIDIIFDTICPWCFIGKRRLEEMLSRRPQLNADIYWHAFLLNPDMPAEGTDFGNYMQNKFGGELRSQRLFAAIDQAGRSVGIEFDFAKVGRTPSTIDSHRLVRYAARDERASEMVETLYQNYFMEGRDIGNRSVLIDIGEKMGFDGADIREYLYSDEDIADIHEQNPRSHRLGISGVPAFIFERQFSISGAQEPNVLERMLNIAEEKQREFYEVGIQPV